MGKIISLERRRLLREVEERMERIAALMERRDDIDAEIRRLVEQNRQTAA